MRLIAAFIFASVALSVAGCSRQTQAEVKAAGHDVAAAGSHVAKATMDAAHEAGAETKRAAHDADHELGNAADHAGKAMRKTDHALGDAAHNARRKVHTDRQGSGKDDAGR